MNIKNQSRSRAQKRNMIFYCCILAVPIVQFLIFYLFINIKTVLLTFQEYDYGTISGRSPGYYFAGLKNLQEFFRMFAEGKDMYALRYSVTNSLWMAIVSFLISAPLSIMFSFYIYKKKFMASAFKMLLFMPSVISSIVICVIFLYVAEDAIPTLINQLFNRTDTMGLLSSSHYGVRQATLVFFSSWVGFGGAVLIYSGAMNGINDSVLEAAQIDGAKEFRQLVSVVFPMIFPTFTTLIVSTIAGIFVNQYNLFSFYSSGNDVPYEIYTMGYFLYRKTQGAGNTFAEYPIIATMGFCISLIIAPLSLLIHRLLKKCGYNDQ